jgi:hypothetical protein
MTQGDPEDPKNVCVHISGSLAQPRDQPDSSPTSQAQCRAKTLDITYRTCPCAAYLSLRIRKGCTISCWSALGKFGDT